MELKRLRVLGVALDERLDSFPFEVTGAVIFFFHADGWFELAPTPVVKSSGGDEQTLERVRISTLGFERPRGSKFVYFWLRDRRAVIRLEFAKSIQTAAQEKCQKTLQRLNTDADNYYHATHDSLTGLKNRSAFEQCLTNSMQRHLHAMKEMRLATEGSANASASIHSAFLLALDIDNFKTINDRFGHGYGDLVLASLGWRLEEVVQNFQQKNSGRLKADVFRLGGEEFEVLVDGNISEKDVFDFAEDIRSAVSSKSLPSLEEFEKLKARDFYDGSELRSEAQRNVSVSIGVAMISKISSDKSPQGRSAPAVLKRQADLALYSAKLGGKDRVRNFSDILSAHGKVSEVDLSNGVLSIDIGKEVGVKNGQEFFVYAPRYDGLTDYYLGEGRSRKRVGVYPKYKVARIAVFDVQNEVSFCRVEYRENGVVEVHVGSSLEAIPLGSIAHIVTTADAGHHFVGRDAVASELRNYTGGSVIISVTLRRIEEISEQFGMARANAILGLIGQVVISSVGKAGRFGQLAVGSISAVRSCDSESDAGDITKEISRQIAEMEAPPGVDIGIGWIFTTTEGAPQGLQESANENDLIDASILAASYDAFRGGHIHQFDSNTLWHSLYTSRVASQYDRMIADFERFNRVSVPKQWTFNQMALMYVENNDFDRAIDLVKIALGMDEVSGVVRGNYAGMLIMAKKYSAALEAYDEVELLDQDLVAMLFAKFRSSPDEFIGYVHSRAEEIKLDAINSAWLSSEELTELRASLQSILHAG